MSYFGRTCYVFRRISWRRWPPLYLRSRQQRLEVPVTTCVSWLAPGDSPLGMHRGLDNTYHVLGRDFYWRGMEKATKCWVARCLECLKHKSADQQHGLRRSATRSHASSVLWQTNESTWNWLCWTIPQIWQRKPPYTYRRLPILSLPGNNTNGRSESCGVLLQLEGQCLIMYSLK